LSMSVGDVPTRLIVGVAPFNALLNYLLVWGPPPFGVGFIGAPIATAISFNLLALSSIIYGVFFVPKTAWHRFSRRTFTNLGVLVQLLAGVGQTASEWWSWELIGLAASFLGPVSLATQSILLVSASTTFQAPFALGIAASVRIGNLLGEQNAERARIATKMSLLLALVFAVIFSTIFLVFRKNWGHLFNDDPDVVSLVAEILPLVALFQVVDGLSAVTGGIFRARGKQFTGALLNLSAYYVIGIPFGLWLTFKKDMGLHGLWIGLTVSLVYCAVFASYLCLKTDWEREDQPAAAAYDVSSAHEKEKERSDGGIEELSVNGSDIDLLSWHEHKAGRLVVDPEEAKIEFGEKVASRLKLTRDGTKVLWPQPADDPNDPQNWSSRRKTIQLIIITLAAIVPDFDSGIGIATIFALAEQFDTTT
ncbi:hypothetical protein EWM64_g10613, partial [Hericium alpestre]